MSIIETPKGTVFSLSHSQWTKCFTAVGPLEGGRSVINLDVHVRVSTTMDDYDDAVRDLTEQLVRLGY